MGPSSKACSRRDEVTGGLQQVQDLSRFVLAIAECRQVNLLAAQVWRRQQATAPTAFPARASKSIAAIEELVAGFPLNNPQDERLQELMDELRAKFKVRLLLADSMHLSR